MSSSDSSVDEEYGEVRTITARSNDPQYRREICRQNACFALSVLSVALVAFAVVCQSPWFHTGFLPGVNEYDAGSGEVSIDATNSKTQDMEAANWRGNDQSGHDDKSIIRDEDELDKTAPADQTSHSDVPSTLEKGNHDTVVAKDNPQVEQATAQSKSPETMTDNTPAPITLASGKMYEIVATLFHDPKQFTQGLTYSNGVLYESAGLYGHSNLCKLNVKNGKATKCVTMDKQYFAEGMQVYGEAGNEKLIQLTWKEKNGFIYSAESLEFISEFSFVTTQNEGWGICADESQRLFYVSDGSPNLHVWDMDTLQPKETIRVTRQDGSAANNLNELEFVDGKVLANVWYQDVILVIDPVTGTCEKEYDFSKLWPKAARAKHGADVLNGISVSDEPGVLFVTGKNWDRMFKVKLLG